MKTASGTSLAYWIVVAVWMLCAAVFLGIGLFSFSSMVSNETPIMLGERRMVAILGMQAIGFPAATFLPGPIIDLAKSLGVELFKDAQPTMIGFLKDWVLLLVLGGFQWFVVLPWLYRLFTRRRLGRTPPS